jgi:predicted DNA-binding transcriptional regulator YafY
MNKAERLINLIAMLLEAKNPVSLERIRSAIPGYQQASMASFKRMFERDKSDLREMGVPIQVEQLDPFGEESGYRIPKEEYYLPEIEFTAEEKIALLLVNRLSSGQVVPLSREAQAALLKLSPDLGDGSRLGHPGSPQQWKFSPQSESVEGLSRLWDAAVKRKSVLFAYRSLGDEGAIERKLDPYGLYFDRGAWYVVGFCHLREEIRSFRVSRLDSEVEQANPGEDGPDFERPQDFRLREHARVLPWEFEEGAEYEAAIRFSPRLAWLVERDLGDVYRFEPAKDGGGVLHVRVRNEDAFMNWLLSYAEDAELVSPPALRKKVKSHLREMLAELGGKGK